MTRYGINTFGLKPSLTKTDLQMLHSVLRAPLTFFELTPSGRYVLSTWIRRFS
jgi:hypothetical protein